LAAIKEETMPLKDILVVFTGAQGAAARLAVAAELARRDGAHLVGLYLIPAVVPFTGGLPFSGSQAEIKALAALEKQRREAALADSTATEKAFHDAARQADLSEEWRISEGAIPETATLHARHADLAVLGQDDPDHPVEGAAGLLETVLLGSGRPVLAVPYAGRFPAVGRNVMVSWNATKEAARAINDALPILEKAEKVTVFSVNPPDQREGGPAWPGADIALHLARHGVKAEASATVSHEIDIGNTILSRAADFGADLIVMGGYGHSRQREYILGGATRTLLQHMTVPVLMSH
jgi:nucleotide-binding universal stress UspA family protein